MSAYPADLTCFADPFKSTVATITFFYFIAACYYATISIVYCYYKLSREVLKAYDFVDLELRATNGTVNDTKSRSWNYKLASFKIYLTMAIYCSLMLISVTFLVTIQYGPKVTVSQIGFSKLADILTILFFLIGLTSNSVLLMMLHTGVNREMNSFISKFKRK
ncbi:hypothetical protein K502DRAFT_323076 [Neoconidiobolus thromboides FSU 785]|nr:hypothetical protein K502DRAFT_323076 [Neoconidiobolus thromboides FSU 785]